MLDKKMIYDVLIELGFSFKHKGFWYLKEILFYALNNDFNKKNINVGILYEAISDEFDTTSFCIERNIRTAIECSWNNFNYDLVVELFKKSYRKDRPTNKELIVALLIKLNERK